MKKLLLAAAASLALALAGCSSKSRLMYPEEARETIPEGKAVITFFRTHRQYIQYQPAILRFAGNKNTFIGIVSADTKIRDIVDPGEYQYVVAYKHGYLLKAKVEANKAYYVRVEPVIGVAKSRFVLHAIKPEVLASNSAMRERLRDADLVYNTNRSERWYQSHSSRMRDISINSADSFKREPRALQQLHFLMPEDGIKELY
jgi:predicted small lipoprotein YifL